MKIFVTFFALLFSTLVSSTTLNKMVVFGDSLSDNGNLYEYMKHQLPLSPPYFEGRFTNGPVWVELLMKYYYPTDSNAHLLDYAFGGAGVLSEDDDDGDDALFTLRREMDGYFLAHQDRADKDSLYVIWIGSNNYLAVPEDNEKVLIDVNKGIRYGLRRLADKGAKHIMIVNLPNLGNIPAARDFDAVDVLTYLSKQHNIMLEKNVKELQGLYPSVQWLFFDINYVLDDIMVNPGPYGFTNVKDTCYEEVIDQHSPKNRSILKMVASVKPHKGPDACNGHLFFDPVHPSGPVHQLMAERTKMMFDEIGITFE